MTAGLNLRVGIHRINYDSDDAVGGAMPTGTLQYTNLPASMSSDPPEQLLLQQGLDTVRPFKFNVGYTRGLDIRERDEIEIERPYNHPYVDERFRIKGVQESLHVPYDPRNYIILYATRSVRAHAQQ